MKAIINGKRYDSDSATLIGASSYGGSRTDFQWWKAGLYRTPRSGRYFLAGEGGPMSQWARPIDSGSTSGSEGIIPLSAAEALEWAERHLSTNEVEAAFSETIEDA